MKFKNDFEFETRRDLLRLAFDHVVTNSHKENTYKFALARSLLERCRTPQSFTIKYSEIASDFFDYYWVQVNLDIFHGANNQSFEYIKEEFNEYFLSYNLSKIKKEQPEKVNNCIEKIKKDCSHYVIPIFEENAEDYLGKKYSKRVIYHYEKSEEIDLEGKIILNPLAMKFFRDHNKLLFHRTMLEWLRFLNKKWHKPKLLWYILYIRDIILENINESYDKILKCRIEDDHAKSAHLSRLCTQMLNLINHERIMRGLNPVKQGRNGAAQYHATSNLNNYTSAHWGVDGLKPYMRYSLFGGYQYNAENVSGLSYRRTWSFDIVEGRNYYHTIPPEERIFYAMRGFMSSLGHRDNILDPDHKFVNIGIACDDYNMHIVQHFEYHYVSFSKIPSINNNILSFSVYLRNGALFSDPNIHIYYDPPPHKLTRGQLATTYSYSSGSPVSIIQSPDSYHPNRSYRKKRIPRCPNPYDASPNAPEPQSVSEAHKAHERAKINCQKMQGITKIVPCMAADIWHIRSYHLSMKTDISQILEEYGPGVYTILVRGDVGDYSMPIAEYSIFHEILPSIGYPNYNYVTGTR